MIASAAVVGWPLNLDYPPILQTSKIKLITTCTKDALLSISKLPFDFLFIQDYLLISKASLTLLLSMILKEICPLSPQERAIKLGLDLSYFPHFEMDQSALQATNYIKRKDRSNWKLHQWGRKQYYKTDATYQLFNCPDQVQRVNMDELSLQEFTQKYQKTNTPLIIRGCTDSWSPTEKWSHRYFYENYLNAKFKVGQDDDGYKLKLTYKNYIEYLLYNKDDSPLYLFQSSLQDKEETKPIIDNFSIPPYFKDDLFKLAGEKKRPPHRWFIMGAERSGTTIHIDPLLTSAWNASLRGHKRWVLFGQDVPKSIVKGREFRHKNYDDEAINYFVQILPKIKQKYCSQDLQLIQFIQYPGETVFVPGGLWHAVVNLDDTIAVTQNVMTHYCFDKVWRSTRSQRKKFAQSFLQQLKEKDEELYRRALHLNAVDNYQMGQKYCKQEVSLSFTPSSSSNSSSSSVASSDSSSPSEEGQKPMNRVNVHNRGNQLSSRSNSSLSRSREKRQRHTFSQQKKGSKRRLSVGSN